ncbi:MAG: sulfatase-like hydrolase/transferase [Bacteroidota bacterium]
MSKISLLVLIFTLVLSSSIALFENPEQVPDPPNLIFLLADDLRWDRVGFMGDDIISTPTIDSLANQGTVFERGYVTTAICAVSRVSILSGQHGRRHQKWGFGPGFSPEEWNNTYPAQLRANGYRTGFIGKYGVGEFNFASQQFDYWRGFNGQGVYNVTDDDGNPIHLTRRMGQQGAEFIQQGDGDQPFCLSISFKAPHTQGTFNWATVFDPAYAEEYEGTYFPQPESAETQFFDHFPDPAFTDNEARLRWRGRLGDPTFAQNSLEGYYRLVHGIDRAVAQLVTALEASGQADNTVIIFTSDNGMYLGEYGFSGKWYGSEPSIRVPFFIYDPRPGALVQRSDYLALNIDVGPTLLALAGIPIPEVMQGHDLSPIIRGEQAVERTGFFYEHLWPGPNPIPSTQGIVVPPQKYMRYFPAFDSTNVIFEEIYDWTDDSIEVINLEDDPDYRDILLPLFEQYKMEAE